MAVGCDNAQLLVDSILDSCAEMRNIFALIGVCTIGGLTFKIFWNFAKHLWVHFGTDAKVQQRQLKKFGSWAIILGCHDRVGEEFARHLAAGGISLILIENSGAKKSVTQLCAQLEKDFKINCVRICLPSSAADYELAFCDDIVEAVRDKDVGIIINNLASVGILNGDTYSAASNFSPSLQQALTAEHSLQKLNSVLMFASALNLSIFDQLFAPRQRGLILFVISASSSTIISGSNRSTNSVPAVLARKYLESLTDELSNLSSAASNSQVIVQTLQPLSIWQPPQQAAGDAVAVRRNLSPFWWATFFYRPNLFAPPADVYVRWAFLTLGRCRWSTGYFPHTILFCFAPCTRFMNRIFMKIS